MDLILIILQILLLVTLLVAAHELGHFLAARFFRMGVEEFALGLGRPYFTWMKRKHRLVPSKNDSADWSSAPDHETTAFTLRPFPLGGFVRIKGMMPEEDGSEVRIPGGFYSKPPWQRFMVLFMGPIFSVLTGFAILIPLFMSAGIEEPRNIPVIPTMADTGAAKRAGLQEGDRVLAVDGDRVSTYYDILVRVRDRGTKPATFHVERDGKQLEITVTPELDKSPTPVIGPKLDITSEKRIQSKLGLGVPTERVRLSFGEAAKQALALPVKMIGSLVGAIVQPQRLKDEVGGPIAIAQIAGATAKEGMSTFLMFGGALSISLGIFNLIPISPFDGGQMVVAFVEMLRRGRRLSFRIQNWIAGVGALLTIMLVISIFALDIGRTIDRSRAEKKEPVKRQEQKTPTEPPAR